MEFQLHSVGTTTIAELKSPGLVIESGSDFLDLMANAGSRTLLLHHHHLPPRFFVLKSGLAGEILQKVSNYGLKVGIIGDFSELAFGALGDFIRESNRAGQVVFVSNTQEAIDRFGGDQEA